MRINGLDRIINVPILLGLVVLVSMVFSDCRSSKDMDKHIQESAERKGEVATVRTDSTRTERVDSDSTAAIKIINEYIRKILFADDGRISGIQDEWRTIGSAQLSTGTRRSSEVSVNKETKDSTYSDTNNRTEDQTETIVADSRPVQGSEWGWVALVAGAVIILMCVVLIKEFRK